MKLLIKTMMVVTLTVITIFTVLLFTSCSKEEVKPVVEKATHELPLGVWDMNTDNVHVVAHNVAYRDIKNVSIIIIDDSGLVYSELNEPAIFFDESHFEIYLTEGNDYDNIHYSNTSVNRGYIYFESK